MEREWAITPRGVDNEVGARRIHVGGELLPGEVRVPHWEEGMRWDGTKLRPETTREKKVRLDPEGEDIVRIRYRRDLAFKALVHAVAKRMSIQPRDLFDDVRREAEALKTPRRRNA